MSIVVDKECPKNPTQKRKLKKRVNLLEKLRQTVKDSKVDKEYKDRLTSSMQYL